MEEVNVAVCRTCHSKWQNSLDPFTTYQLGIPVKKNTTISPHQSQFDPLRRNVISLYRTMWFAAFITFSFYLQKTTTRKAIKLLNEIRLGVHNIFMDVVYMQQMAKFTLFVDNPDELYFEWKYEMSRFDRSKIVSFHREQISGLYHSIIHIYSMLSGA